MPRQIMPHKANIQSDDKTVIVADGLMTIGALRQQGRGFEVFSCVGEKFKRIGMANSRAEAMRRLREARGVQTKKDVR